MAAALSERFIQDAVARRLNDDHYRRRSAYVSTEVYTRLKRADVLLAFRRARKRPYVVVVEAKSRNTIHQLKLKPDAARAAWAGRILSMLLILGLMTILGYQWYFHALNTLLLLLLFSLGSVLATYSVTALRLRLTRSIPAIRQLAQYPANESWIAVGEDTFVSPADLRTLRRQCRKQGVGLIVVDARGRLSLHLLPRPRHVFNDYLNRYGKRDDIIEEIDRRPKYGPTPAERRLNRRRFLTIFLMLAFVGSLILLVYDDRHGAVVPDPFADLRARSPASPGIVDSEGNQTDPAPFGTDPAPAAPPADCPEVGLNETVYLVVDGVLEPTEARQRVRRLAAAGIRGHELLDAACLSEATGTNLLAVYTGTRYYSPEAAGAAATNYEALLNRLGIRSEAVRTMMIRPQR